MCLTLCESFLSFNDCSRPQKCSLSVSVTDKYFGTSGEHLQMLLAWSQIKRICTKKIDFFEVEYSQICTFLAYFWSFLRTHLSFLVSERLINTFYGQMEVATFFLTCILILEYIMGVFRVQFANIFGKKAWGGKKGGVFSPPFPI